MLSRTFLHFPNVDAARERRFWAGQILCWDDLLRDRDLFDMGPAPEFEAAACESRQRLANGDARWFDDRLGEQAWRLAREFDDGRIAYLDIETDNTKGDETPRTPPGVRVISDELGGTTVAAIWDGQRARVFLRGRDLHEIPEYLSQYKVLCTFNGKSFDLPYLEMRFGKDFFKGAHLDLRPLTRTVGLTGGLKKIEALVGIERPQMIRDYTGFHAVKLWGAFQRGRSDALEPLARYNLADAVNLQALLRHTYNLAVIHDELPFQPFERRFDEGANEAVEAGIARLMQT